jgi:hypothetical protein
LLKHLEVTDPVAVAAATEQQADLVATVEMAVRLKIDCTGNESRRLRLPPGRLITLDAEVMREIIDPVIQGIVELVLDNITERVENEESRIIEVGTRPSTHPVAVELIVLITTDGLSGWRIQPVTIPEEQAGRRVKKPQ